uniref:Protein sll1483 n=1 Tax=Lepeophtheirus salmonis TaxID=72036 RepID=D3PIM6_LEPSM|nr:protein sll1483 [Lepeophtheirus salmonis]
MKIIALFLIVAIGSSTHAMPVSTCTEDCNLVNVLVGMEKFSGLVASVKAAGLVNTLLGEGPFTVFAPSDHVFKKLPIATLISAASNKEALKTLLLRHVIPGQKIMAGEIPSGTTTLPTAAPGESITIINEKGSVKLMTSGGSATVVSTDIEATNGVIHIINGLL